MLSLKICLIATIIAAGEAQTRKCLQDIDCHQDECCAQAFYSFRCEKRGYNNGDRCGLCGCANGLTCVSEGMHPFRILSGRGHCRFQSGPEPFPILPHATIITSIPTRRPQPAQVTKTSRPQPVQVTKTQRPQPARMTKAPSYKPRPIRPSKDHFYETFQPIYEQFIELAASVAGISLDELMEEDQTTTTSKP